MPDGPPAQKRHQHPRPEPTAGPLAPLCSLASRQCCRAAPGRPTDRSGTRSRSSWSLLNAGNVLHAKKLPGLDPMVATKTASYRKRTVGCSRYVLCFSQKPEGRNSTRFQVCARPGRASWGPAALTVAPVSHQ